MLLKGLMEDTSKRVSASKKKGNEPTNMQKRKHQITYLAHQVRICSEDVNESNICTIQSIKYNVSREKMYFKLTTIHVIYLNYFPIFRPKQMKWSFKTNGRITECQSDKLNLNMDFKFLILISILSCINRFKNKTS